MTATAERDLRSLETRLSELSLEQREEALQGIDPRELDSWRFKARADQLEATESKFPTIVFIGGRGAGKTRTGAEWVKDKVEHKPVGKKDMKLRFALVSRTAADVRDTIVQGDSGLFSVFPENQKPAYIGHLRLVRFYDGSEALMFSSQEPDQLRGPQFHYALADELAAWEHKRDDSGLTSWDNLQIATRLGDNPQTMATTTPRRVPAVKDLYKKASAPNSSVHLVTGASTFDNPYLSAAYLEVMLGLYEGTRLSAQELYGLMLGDVEGALWAMENLNQHRIDSMPGRLPLIVVGVDPSVSDKPRDECGIVVAAATGQKSPYRRHAYVLEDRSVHGPPSKWAKEVASVARKYNAPIVAERNQGGALIKDAIHQVDPTLRVRTVHARVNKQLRAEPITLAYDQGRVHHVGNLAQLEDQLTTWVPEDTKDSPDRLDAMVYALSALVLPSSARTGVGRASVKAARGKIPPQRRVMGAGPYGR